MGDHATGGSRFVADRLSHRMRTGPKKKESDREETPVALRRSEKGEDQEGRNEVLKETAWRVRKENARPGLVVALPKEA